MKMNLAEWMFFDTWKFLNLMQNGIQICNLGSSPGKFGFDYTGQELHGANLASSPQSLAMDFKILRRYREFLSEKAFVLIPLCPFSCIRTPYREPSHYWKYYPVLPPQEIPFYSEETHREICRFLSSLDDGHTEYPSDPLLAFDGTPRENEMKQSAQQLISGWKREFSMQDFSEKFSEDNLSAFRETAKLLHSLLDYCRNEHLRPALVLMPASHYFQDVFTPEFRRKYIDHFLEEACSGNTPVLDYWDHPNFHSDDCFLNALMLNKKGRKLLTEHVLADLAVKYPDPYHVQQEELRTYYKTISVRNTPLPFNPLKKQMTDFIEKNPALSPM